MNTQSAVKTAVVTGASSGFGRLIAQGLAAHGYRVLATSRDASALPVHDNIIPVELDVAQPTAARALMDRVAADFDGRLGVLINNAGYGQGGPIAAVTDAEIAAQFEVNVFVVVRLTRALLPSLKRAQGKIINLSSVLGFTGMPYQSLYCASKFAVEGLTESLYYELRPQGLDVHLIEPGAFRTGFATNVKWTPETTDLAYGGMQGFFRKLAATPLKPGSARDPQRVADKIIALCQRRSARLRHRVGHDAHGLYYLRRFLPQGVTDALLLKAFGRFNT